VADRLYRSRKDRILAGVAGGVAEMIDIDPSVVRVVWALLVFLTGGFALLVYIVMAIVVPERPDSVEASRTGDPGAGPASGDPGAGPAWGDPAASRPSGDRARHRDQTDRGRPAVIAGVILIHAGSYFFIRQFLPAIDLGFWWPTVAIGLGVVLIVFALMPSRRSD
jgi:phage shock protein C